MSNQYPLPAGYPPPGATYGMNQGPPPLAAGFVPPPVEQINVGPQNLAPVPGPAIQTGPSYHEASASYAPAAIPGDGQGVGALPYGYLPPGAAQTVPVNQAAPGISAGIDDPILIAEMNEAADVMARNKQPTIDHSLSREGAVPDLMPAVPPVVAAIETPGPAGGNTPDARPFFLVSEHNEKCVLEVRKENSKPGTSVGLNKKKPTASPGQLWYIGADGFLRTKVADLMIEADGNHKSVHTATETGDARQRWIIDGNKIVNAVFKDECLTIKKGLVKFKDDADVVADKYEGKPIQHWKQVYAD